MDLSRLTAAQLAAHLSREPIKTRRLILKLRRIVLKTVPEAVEAIRFGCLCYHHPNAVFGAIGGNICMIEARRQAAVLSFIHGATLPNQRLLRGRAKSKRFVLIQNLQDASDPQIIALLRAAANLRLSKERRRNGADE